MSGERDLERLLETLSPKLHPERYTFAEGPAPEAGWFALVCEDEGLTTIRPDPAGEWARISLGVHSSLEAVGLTAELSRRLASAGIPANMVAASRHDHFFVPWERRDEALSLLGAAPAR